jgi:hypothetical protein
MYVHAYYKRELTDKSKKEISAKKAEIIIIPLLNQAKTHP